MKRVWQIVPTEAIEPLWPLIAPLVAAACELGLNKWDASDFLTLVIEEKAQLWVGMRGATIEAAAITDVIDYPNKRYARVTMGMGEHPQELQEFIAAFEAWAKEIGCDGVQSDMRPGFKGQFVKSGWKQTHVLMEKEF